MQVQLGILTVGSELLDGRVHDTNAHLLCDELSTLGFQVGNILSCDDKIDAIENSLSFLLSHNNTVIVSGGLGPTSDDLTREAISSFCRSPLTLHDAQLEKIKARFAKRGRTFEPSNEKQALIPEQGIVIENPLGTAPGFWIKVPQPDEIAIDSFIIALPGVPSELAAMFSQSVEALLKRHYSDLPPITTAALKLFGLPESVVGSRVAALTIPPTIKVSYRAMFPEIHVLFSSSEKGIDLELYKRRAREAIGDQYIFSETLNLSFEACLYDLILSKGETIALAESCTGGLLSAYLTNTSGASQYFVGAIVSYSNDVKSELLGVRRELIANDGAVSSSVAQAMAINARERLKSSLAVSITGIAGPEGGSDEKPVGTFYIGYADEHGAESHRYFFPSQRDYVRRYACYMALDLIRRKLLGLSPLPSYEPKPSP